MKGYRSTAPERVIPDGEIHWEEQACEAVGDVIEFWGFKRNHGRLWALLYIRNTAMSALELQNELGLSKGAVSMITTDLERWSVIQRVRQHGKQAWHYVAEEDYLTMIRKVLREREISVVENAEEQLALAEDQARAAGDVPESSLKRLRKMRDFATSANGTIMLLLQTLDIFGGDDPNKAGS